MTQGKAPACPARPLKGDGHSVISGRVALQRPGVRLAARPLDGASVLEMDPDQLFLKTLSDLERRTGSEASEYDVLRSSALLRQLLLDGGPLVHQVNRHRRLTLVFRVNVREPTWRRVGSDPPSFWTRHDGLDPETALVTPEVAELKLNPTRASARPAKRKSAFFRRFPEWPREESNLRTRIRSPLLFR